MLAFVAAVALFAAVLAAPASLRKMQSTDCQSALDAAASCKASNTWAACCSASDDVLSLCGGGGLPDTIAEVMNRASLVMSVEDAENLITLLWTCPRTCPLLATLLSHLKFRKKCFVKTVDAQFFVLSFKFLLKPGRQVALLGLKTASFLVSNRENGGRLKYFPFLNSSPHFSMLRMSWLVYPVKISFISVFVGNGTSMQECTQAKAAVDTCVASQSVAYSAGGPVATDCCSLITNEVISCAGVGTPTLDDVPGHTPTASSTFLYHALQAASDTGCAGCVCIRH